METQKLSQEKMEYRVNSLQKDTISATIGEEKQSVSQMINELREEEQKLLNEGGWVRKETKRESVLKSIPLYFHLLMIMSTMIIIFLSILQSHRYLYILDFRLVCLKEDVFIAVWLFYISCLSIYIKFFISPYVENRDFYVKPICTNVQKPEILGTGNGIGFRRNSHFAGYNLCNYYVYQHVIEFKVLESKNGKRKCSISQNAG